jgi:hypothetical protein
VTNQRRNRNRRPIPRQADKEAVQTKEKKPKKGRKDGTTSGADSDAKMKEKPKPKPVVKVEGYNTVAKFSDGEEESVDNREFARQMSNAKKGTITAAKSQVASKPKSVKQRHAKNSFPETSSDNATAPSSNGGYADDDQSPANSPELGATTIMTPVTNGISDMLEKPAPGPSVLRVTSPTNPSKPTKEKKEKVISTETAETKKQRQNKKKAEAKKLQREQEEQERKVLMEKQRRTAREAEGRAAKDGSTFMAAKAPSASAWTGNTPGAPTNGKKAVPTNNFELLDTEESSSSKATVADATAKPTAKAATIPDEMYSPSELFGTQQDALAKMSYEQQVEYATEASTRWEVVKAKNRTKKMTQKNTDPKEQSQSSTDDTGDYQPPEVIAPTEAGQKWNTEVAWVDEDGKVGEKSTVQQDSEWEVS